MGITSVTLPNDVAEKNDFFVAESNTLHFSSTDSLDKLNLSRQLDHVQAPESRERVEFCIRRH